MELQRHFCVRWRSFVRWLRRLGWLESLGRTVSVSTEGETVYVAGKRPEGESKREPVLTEGRTLYENKTKVLVELQDQRRIELFVNLGKWPRWRRVYWLTTTSGPETGTGRREKGVVKERSRRVDRDSECLFSCSIKGLDTKVGPRRMIQNLIRRLTEELERWTYRHSWVILKS